MYVAPATLCILLTEIISTRRLTVKLLIIEDNKQILGNIIEFLTTSGYMVDSAEDGIRGLNLAATGQYDLIVLDLMLPGLDGISLCKRLRNDSQTYTPVIMLTARDSLDDKVTGFDAGADDYLVKPFSLIELKIRIKAVLNRSQRRNYASELHIGELIFNTSTLKVTREGQTVKLSPTGLKLLECLMRASPNVVRRQQLEAAVWDDEPCDSDALRAHIHLLRNALDKPFSTPILETVHSIGYRLVSQN